MYPSEYAYRDDSVNRAESGSANCMRYPNHLLAPGVSSDQYTHCGGMQRKLTDSDLGQEQYQPTDYYVWIAGQGAQLLFIFPTNVSLTTITLNYYSDSVRGLPKLRFYAVPDDFDVWVIPTTSYPRVDVTAILPDGEPADRRNISIKVNINAKKVLMYKFSATYQFAVSEVEFFNCTSKANTLLFSATVTYIVSFNHNLCHAGNTALPVPTTIIQTTEGNSDTTNRSSENII